MNSTSHFVAARQADVMDGVADLAGSIMGATGILWLTSQKRAAGFSENGSVIAMVV
jgi:hypothetical protein